MGSAEDKRFLTRVIKNTWGISSGGGDAEPWTFDVGVCEVLGVLLVTIGVDTLSI